MAARIAREISGEYKEREAEDLEPDDEDDFSDQDITHQRSTA
jgi:hypothetical protein